MTASLRKELEQLVRTENIEFELKNGEKVSTASVIQDTLPEGSCIGTVVALHGAPGSHKDFKYITPYLHEKGIRVVGVNFPDYGLTAGHPELQFDNTERNNYVKAVIDKVGLKEKVIIVGHSRGCENATGSASLSTDVLSGLVLLNPTGLRLHRGLKPFWLIRLVLWLYSFGTVMQSILHTACFKLYQFLGLRVDNGKRAITCIKTMRNLEMSGLLPKISKINEAKNVQVLIAYSGKDLFIEIPITKELANAFDESVEVICPTNNPKAFEEAYQESMTLLRNGHKSVVLGFLTEGHFLQKHQPKIIADSIEAMLLRKQ
ncbi:unnamed protein product [Auanema sp. JU1783]|nr:unnamed protein product [Auanema sp. JU1783]